MRVHISSLILTLLILGSLVSVSLPFSSAKNSQSMLFGTVNVDVIDVKVSENTTHVGATIDIVTTVSANWVVFDFSSFYVQTYYEDHMIESHVFYVFGTGQEIFNVTSTWNTTGVDPGSYVISALAYGSNIDGYVDGVVQILPVRTWIVDDDGPADFSSIQDAINASSDGDTIFVKNGTYYEHVLVNKSVLIVGENRDVTIIDGGDAGIVVHVAANDVLIRGFLVKRGLFGIYVNNSDNCVLSDNIMAGIIDNYAIYAYYSQNCAIERNIVGPNPASGILVTNSDSFMISENRAFDNGGFGLNVNASMNGVISGNEAVGNYYDGIGLGRGSTNCTIVGNNVTNNAVWGIWLDSDVFDNLIYHNDIVMNGVQTSVNPANRWDNGYPYGGNYWSNFEGADLFLGPGQDMSGSDGILDAPLVLNENNTDHYPLVNLWTPPDAAVLNITSCKTIVGEGFSTNVTVSVENLGSKIEELNSTFYANDTFVGYQTFLLTSNHSIVYCNTWDLGALPKGNYSLSVRIMELEGETDLEGNSLNGSWVFITLPGDLNGDKTVDIYDAILLAGCFNSHPYSPHWNPNRDINNDAIIDLFDAIILASNYGQSWT